MVNLSKGKFRHAVRLLHVGALATSTTPLVVATALTRRHRNAVAGVLARLLVPMFWHLGPAYVKLGQLLASRRDILPPNVCAIFTRGFVQPTKTATTYAGSMATVSPTHVAGEKFAVKRIKPDAAKLLELDTAIMLRAAYLASKLPLAAPLAGILHELCVAIRRQNDLEAERRALERFAELESALPVNFPRPVESAQPADLLVMTWLPDQEDHSIQQSPRAAKHLMEVLFEMLFVSGYVHCDLHAGNWWVMRDGRLAIVDAGFCYELDDDLMDHFAEFFLGLAAANSSTCADRALAVCIEPLAADAEQQFRRGMDVLVSKYAGRRAGDFSLPEFAADLFKLQRKHHAYARADFIFPFTALLAIEGQVRSLDPTLDFQDLAGPPALRGLIGRARSRR